MNPYAPKVFRRYFKEDQKTLQSSTEISPVVSEMNRLIIVRLGRARSNWLKDGFELVDLKRREHLKFRFEYIFFCKDWLQEKPFFIDVLTNGNIWLNTSWDISDRRSLGLSILLRFQNIFSSLYLVEVY